MENLKQARPYDDEMVHVALPCPACGEPVSAVADVLNQRSRWCCIPCQTIGSVPWAIVNQTVPRNAAQA